MVLVTFTMAASTLPRAVTSRDALDRMRRYCYAEEDFELRLVAVDPEVEHSLGHAHTSAHSRAATRPKDDPEVTPEPVSSVSAVPPLNFETVARRIARESSIQATFDAIAGHDDEAARAARLILEERIRSLHVARDEHVSDELHRRLVAGTL